MLSEKDIAEYLSTNKGVKDALALHDSFSEAGIQLLARGEYNQNYLFTHPGTGKKLVFRVNLGSQLHLDDQIEYEARALTLLQESGRTPLVHYVDDSKTFFDQGILIEEWLPGRALDYGTDLQVAAAILADIHAVVPPKDHGLLEASDPLKSMLQECEMMFEQYRLWEDAEYMTLKRIDRWFTRVEGNMGGRSVGETRHIISTEVNSQNFLINKQGKSYLVDWEKPLVGEVEQDLAHFLVPTTTCWKTNVVLSPQERTRFTQCYCQAVNGRFDTEGVSERLFDYLAITCLRGITWAAMALAQHRTGERSVADAYTLNKIEHFLSPDFLGMLERDHVAFK